MKHEENCILGLLGTALFGKSTDRTAGAATDWQAVYRVAKEQGVYALVWEAIRRTEAEAIASLEPKLKLRWGIRVMEREQRQERQWELANELGADFAGKGLRTVVLKGWATARYYPVPAHRIGDDLDCFLGEGYEKGNEWAKQWGAPVVTKHFKHSQIYWKGLHVENHRYCSHLLFFSRRSRRFERVLQRLLREEGGLLPGSACLWGPSPKFELVFTVSHAWSHFLGEGLQLRHLCDWAVLLERYGRELDVQEFRELLQIRGQGLLAFMESITRMVHQYWGVKVPEGLVENLTTGVAEQRLLDEIFQGRIRNFQQNVGKRRRRGYLLYHAVRLAWKFPKYQGGVALWNILNNVTLFFVGEKRLLPSVQTGVCGA